MHLKQPGSTYNACGSFIKNKQSIQKFKQTGDTKYIYRNETDKACLQHDMPYGDFKDLAKRTVSDKVLSDKAFNIAKSPKYYRYQRGLASMIYNFFKKKSGGSGVTTLPNKIKQNQRPLDLATQQLPDELHKPIIKEFKKRTIFSTFKYNI